MENKRSLKANLSAARSAVEQMKTYWNQWKKAAGEQDRLHCIAAYAAAVTNCKVFIENYLKRMYPNENQLPMKISQDIRAIVEDIVAIEKVNEKMLQKALNDIERLSRDAA